MSTQEPGDVREAPAGEQNDPSERDRAVARALADYLERASREECVDAEPFLVH